MKTMGTNVKVAGRVRVIGDSAPPAGTNRRTRTGFVRRPVGGSVELGSQRPETAVDPS